MCFQVQALSIIIKHTHAYIYAERKRRERIMKGEAAHDEFSLSRTAPHEVYVFCPSEKEMDLCKAQSELIK